MTTRRQLRSMLLRTGFIFAALGALSAPASASLTTYTYTANWTSWMDNAGLNRGLYAGLDRAIEFDFTVSAPLASVGCGTSPYSIYCQTDVKAQVQSWHYNGGSSFLNIGSDVSGSVLTALLLSTDAAGNILNDRFYLNGPVVIPSLSTYQSRLSEAHDGYDQQLLTSDFSRFYGGSQSWISLSEGMSNMQGAGSWSFATFSDPIGNSVPEPATYSLMLAGVVLSGVVARRRKTQQA